MFTLTKGDRVIIGQNQKAISDLTAYSLQGDTKLDDPNLTKDEASEIIRRMEGYSKKIKRLAEQNEAIIKRGFKECIKFIK